MESELSPDKEKNTPPVPIKTYQWEDLRRARDAGAYPWTHFLKVPLEGEITAEDIIRETTPRRSMSRELSRSRTHSPVDGEVQRILNLDSSPGSSRRHGEEGADEGVHIPNFSKEVSLESEEDNINQAVHAHMAKRPESQASSTHTHLATPVEIPKNVSPKGILKRRVPEQQYNIGVTEIREKTKCCHPLVNKIKHLADKTLQKLEKVENEKSPVAKRKKNEDGQEIRQLRSSPSAVRRQKFSAIKLGDSDEMSKTMSADTPPPRKKKEHIYEDIEESKQSETEKSLHFSPDVELRGFEADSRSNSNKENESISERKSTSSYDPSLVADDATSLKPEEHIMEILHKKDNVNKEAILLDEEMEPDEPNVDEIFQNQLDETRPKNDSPNITITEIIDEDIEVTVEQTITIPIETSPSPSPIGTKESRNDAEFEREWSKPSSDHEYEIIEKPSSNILYAVPGAEVKPKLVKGDDELSSTTSLERKFLQHGSDEEDQAEEKENGHGDGHDEIFAAEALQKDIEDRFFVNTPSTVSRTECEVSTSQVDSSALENLPLKRDSRAKNSDNLDSKIQQRIREGTGKLRSQADKLKTKLQSIKAKQFKMPDKPTISFPERAKFKMPERPKITLSERPRFSLPDRRKFSLPDRPKFKKINISEKLSLKDRKKFTLPDRPKFSVPDQLKFKMPERPKINFPSLGRKKEYKIETDATEFSSESPKVATVDFEAKTFPRLFNRKKKAELQKTSSSPTIERDDTPPPTFTFTRVKKTKAEPSTYIPDSPQEPREYGKIDNEEDENVNSEHDDQKRYEATYDFDKMDTRYLEKEAEPSHFHENHSHQSSSIPNISPSNQEYSHINEIDNDEFFVRPRGISRENIQVREYLSDEIRQAFQIPKNALRVMGNHSGVSDEHMYDNDEAEADPELMTEENEPMRYSSEDLNDRDDGYYTFPPVRPSRAKRKKKDADSIKYIDDSVHASMQFSEVDLGLPDDRHDNHLVAEDIEDSRYDDEQFNQLDFAPTVDLHSIHEYANDDVIEYPDNVPVQSQTLPMPPRRKKKSKRDMRHSSLNDFNELPPSELWEEPQGHTDDIVVYRTEHEYIVPHADTTVPEHSPVPPRRNRSRSSRGTSFCDDDRTSHGAESLTLDTHLPQTDEIEREIRHESPGYATVDKTPCLPPKGIRRSISKTPPVRRRKSNSSERKYYTVGSTKNIPDRPPRKKSSTSLMTLDSFSKRSMSGDFTQYVEIDEPQMEEAHKDLKSGEIVSKMKDRPLPPPPRPPRGPRRKKKDKASPQDEIFCNADTVSEFSQVQGEEDEEGINDDVVEEIEVSTQTDPLPDDVDYELGMDENLDISMSSSLRDIVDEESILGKSRSKIVESPRFESPRFESPRFSRPTSRSEKLSDPKLTDLVKTGIGRTSPTVILVERRVSSPTRINEREEMLTEASLTVQHIDIDESQIPDVPPLPKSRGVTSPAQKLKVMSPTNEERALERVVETSRDIQLDNLVTQRLQVRDLDVGRLNVSELQASKILVSDIEGMTLQVTELDSKSGHISVSGIEFSQSVIDEIVKKFAEISTNHVPAPPAQPVERVESPRPVSRSEQTQTDAPPEASIEPKIEEKRVKSEEQAPAPPPPPDPPVEEVATPPQRPPPPDLTPLLYSYLQDINISSGSFYPPRQSRERPFTDFHDPQHQSPPPPTRRAKRKPAAPHSESSSDDERPCPSPRRMPPPVKAHEPTITEAGAQFLRVCQTSISRTIRNMFNSLMTYISGTEDKKDVQMALVIFLVLIAGLIMFGLSDSRTIHHHHWEFFNPPDGKP